MSEESKVPDAERADGAERPDREHPAGAENRSETPARKEAARTILQLPGVAAISVYMLLLAGVIVIGVVGHHYPPLFLVLAIAFIAASGGLMRLLRWAWALTLAAVVLLAAYNLWIFSSSRMGSALVQGLLNLVFILYLVRIEVREKLH
ncbi:MAG: hypothetical protein WBE76_11140 [Terracidiphilus sp.]